MLELIKSFKFESLLILIIGGIDLFIFRNRLKVRDTEVAQENTPNTFTTSLTAR
jgi:hypothetical protein